MNGNNRNMKILFDIRPLLERRPAGVSLYTAGILSGLAKLPPKHSYTLWSNARGRSVPDALIPNSPAFTRTETRRPNKLLNADFLLNNKPKLEKLVGDFDLAYFPNLNFFATKKPYIMTVHDLSFVRYPDFFSAKQRLWHALVRPERTLTRATHVIAVSEHTKHDIIETYRLAPEKISVVSPGVSEKYFAVSTEDKKRVAKKYHLPERFLLYLGTLEPRKNVSAIISALEQLGASGLKLVIAGGRGWLDSDIFAKAKKSSQWSEILFLDYVEEEDKPGLYASAAAFVYPSFYEGFGMPPLEAMAAGCPIIASHSSSLGEVVGDAGLLIDPYKVDELAEAMRAIANDDALRVELIKRGRERARKFSWIESARKLEVMFDQI